jgi:rhodanese-related sulfurtransferase
MRRILMTIGAVVLLATAVSACDPTFSEVSNKDLLQRLTTADDMLVVLDVRSAQEYASGHVPRAINIPHDQMATRMNELRARDNAEFVVYCESGRRADKAERMLKSDGFINIHHLQGDMAQWRKDGLPTEK